MTYLLSRAAIASFAAAALMAGTALAQDYPNQPINVVVPFSAGGPTDTVARLVAQAMSDELGQQVLIQNVGGAGGTLGAGQVAVAANDGYNLLLHHIGMSTAMSLYANLPFDSVADFEPIGLITEVPMVLVARANLEPASLEELVAYIQENGEDVIYGNAGIGAASHLCGVLLQDALGVKVTEVPYQGTGPALTDLIGGQIDLMCDQTTNTTNQILAGEIKAYAVTTGERLNNLPDVPTATEGGLDLQVGIWHGLYAPAGTDPAIIERLSAALQVALADETVIERFAELGTAPEPQENATPEALAEKLSSQIDIWKEAFASAGVAAQ